MKKKANIKRIKAFTVFQHGSIMLFNLASQGNSNTEI